MEGVWVCGGVLGVVVGVAEGRHWQQNQHAHTLDSLLLALLYQPLDHQALNIMP